MTSVTRLRPAALLAEASGAPRPAPPSPGRPAAAGPATIIQLRPSAEPAASPDPPAPPDPSASPEPSASPAGTGTTPDGNREGTCPWEADPDLSQRISGIARSVAQGALEVLGGSRPLQQMARWLDPENYERLQLRANLVRCIDAARNAGHGDPRPSADRHVVVRSARVCPISPGVYEASVVTFDQKRVRAVALRIEQRRGAWRVTALEIG
ncbi:Rv3235 family protein [Arthrobacter sp. IIF3SC--B10]|uniref:Rv3235 family protein n=1 Tax=Arthrobacter burdickii TaxID=3035920 RepID=A0ABT8K0T3_9MICC|nr:Rv3235 family protein [Arthrobacter burdickii]MDN4611034.1 Rv3235 family protein [Arthrobacter burdickii]